jgi:hypothetical protein
MGALCLSSFGCFPGFSIRNIDQVPGDDASVWEKPGATRLDIGRARLECGALSPWIEYKKTLERAGYVDEASRLNHGIQVDACMEKSGYTSKVTKRYNAKSEMTSLCNQWGKKYYLPVCQPGAPVMERSAERRLNSNYCKSSPRSYEHCKATAVYPPGCDNIIIPDPVCLP